MTHEQFKEVHSDLIMQVQCIENDLRQIYAAMKEGDFEENFRELQKASLGRIIIELRELDYSDGYRDLSEEEYELVNRIRELRNYWCHQCFLDYVYIEDELEREKRFQEIADCLYTDESRTWQLHRSIEKLRIKKMKEYRSL